MDTPHPPPPAAQPDPLPAPLPAQHDALSPPETVSLDDLNAAAAGRERDDEAWYTRALRRRTPP